MRRQIADIKRLLIREFRTALLRSTHDRFWMSAYAIAITKSQLAFSPRILGILPTRPKPEMSRVNAEWIITTGAVV